MVLSNSVPVCIPHSPSPISPPRARGTPDKHGANVPAAHPGPERKLDVLGAVYEGARATTGKHERVSQTGVPGWTGGGGYYMFEARKRCHGQRKRAIRHAGSE